jgi:hypothetical protein
MPAKKYYKPAPLLRAVCACGCGKKITGTRRRRYFNTAHRMRASRRRAAARTPDA